MQQQVAKIVKSPECRKREVNMSRIYSGKSNSRKLNPRTYKSCKYVICCQIFGENMLEFPYKTRRANQHLPDLALKSHCSLIGVPKPQYRLIISSQPSAHCGLITCAICSTLMNNNRARKPIRGRRTIRAYVTIRVMFVEFS